MIKHCSDKSKYKNDPQYICNTKSGRFVKKSGLIGKKIFLTQRNGVKSRRIIRRRSVRKSGVKSRRIIRRRSVRKSGGVLDNKLNVEFLEENGYVVFPINFMNTSDILKIIRNDMLKTMENFPEYKNKPTKYSLGGFSALNNPASFHNPFVRQIRTNIMQELLPFFQEYVKILPKSKRWNLEQIVDRMMFRPKGVSATAESWHRDEATLAKESDKIFGGWLNFDDTDQYFSCVPKTHKGIRGHSGFAPIKDKSLKAQYNKDKIKVVIPPGHMLLFYEHLVHEVLGKKTPKDIHRLFLGWRITKSKDSLYPLDSRLEDQSVMPLKSNQIPPMYATLHWTNWRQKIVDFSRNFKDICIESRRVASGKDKGKTYDIVHRNMQSLEEYGLPLYKKYSKPEIDILKPNNNWILKSNDGKSRRYKLQ